MVLYIKRGWDHHYPHMSLDEFMKIKPGQYSLVELKSLYRKVFKAIHPDTFTNKVTTEQIVAFTDHYTSLLNDNTIDAGAEVIIDMVVKCTMYDLIMKNTIRLPGLDMTLALPGYITPFVQYENGYNISFVLYNKEFHYDGDSYAIIWDDKTFQWVTVCHTEKPYDITTFYGDTFILTKEHNIFPNMGVPYESMFGPIVRSPLIITKI